MAQDIGPANVNVRAVSVKCDNPVHRVAMANRVAPAGSLKSSASISKIHNQTKLGLFTCSWRSFAVMATPPPPFGATYARFS